MEKREKQKQPLQVLSYNIHKGFSPNSRRFSLKGIRQALRRVHPDLVFLQEVLGENKEHQKRVEKWPTQSQFEFLADELWPHYAYGKNAVYTSGHHGNAILSKFPIVEWENIDISTNRLEQRGLLHAIIEIPEKKEKLHAICVHLGLFEAERLQQIQKICSRINSHVPHHEPLIIAGDFNDWRMRASPIFKKKLDLQEAFLALTGEHARSFPSWLPSLRLDRIYFRGLEASQALCLSGNRWAKLSDHMALSVHLSF